MKANDVQAVMDRHGGKIIDLALKARSTGETDIAVLVFEDAQGGFAVGVSGAREKLLRDTKAVEGVHPGAVDRALERAAAKGGAWVLVAMVGGALSFEIHVETYVIANPPGTIRAKGGVA